MVKTSIAPRISGILTVGGRLSGSRVAETHTMCSLLDVEEQMVVVHLGIAGLVGEIDGSGRSQRLVVLPLAQLLRVELAPVEQPAFGEEPRHLPLHFQLKLAM